MDANTWEQRYQTGDMPWEKGAPSPGLVDFLSGHPDLPRGSVLVPGCGTGHDILAWCRAGFDTHGRDLAPSAIQKACARIAESGADATVRLGDFLVPSEDDGTFDWVFEHTLFCAIQPDRRADYERSVARCLRPEGHFLAVYYLIDDRDGPPFGVTKEEVLSLFSPRFALLESWVPRSYPNREGLEWMVWWKLKPTG
jgi:methyl halide transferase